MLNLIEINYFVKKCLWIFLNVIIKAYRIIILFVYKVQDQAIRWEIARAQGRMAPTWIRTQAKPSLNNWILIHCI